MTTWLSPHNAPIIGTYDTVPGTALINDISDDGEPEYAGETEMIWDDQTPQLRDGRIIFVDEGDGQWTFDRLHKGEPS